MSWRNIMILVLLVIFVLNKSVFGETANHDIIRTCNPGGQPASKRCTYQIEMTLYDYCRKYYSYRTTRQCSRHLGYAWWSWLYAKLITIKRERKDCCSGYGGPNCKPMCHGLPYVSACNRNNEGHVLHKNDQIVTCSGGACMLPNKCERCNTGYYGDDNDGYCRACTPIIRCNIPRCLNGTYSTCSWCDGEVVHNTPGKYAYTSHVDQTKCLKACSWRPGTRCYPGVCNQDMLYPGQCTCADGFSGSDCATFSKSAVEEKLTINSPEMTLTGETKLVLPDPQYPERKVWTNKIDWSLVTLEVPVKFAAPAIDPESMKKQTYIDFNKTKIGIIDVTVNAVLSRGNATEDWIHELNCNFSSSCKVLETNVHLRNTQWNNILQGGYPSPFAHLDTIDVTITLTNGGTVYYYNREEEDRVESYKINGKTATRNLELEIDLFPPIHCMENIHPCDIHPLIAPDYVNETQFEISWSNWEDANSGLRWCHIEVFLLKMFDKDVGILESDGTPLFEAKVNATGGTAWLNVSQPGPYSVEMSVLDWAGNEKPTRRIIIFDDESVVGLTGQPSFVYTADPSTHYTWINRYSEQIEIRWPDRFINERHLVHGWLNEVSYNEHISKDLDDIPGMSDRSIAAVHHIQGVVRFTVGYKISYGVTERDTLIDPVNVEDELFDQQRLFINETLIDGKQLTFFIRGYDVMGEYAEDNTTVTIDLSPPVIENMWLTKGDILNITVHSEEDLDKLTIEWEAFDMHSGLHTITWRIFDNFTETEIVHGQSHETTQGETQTLDECQKRYANHSRGPRCYCTPFDGCFHKHYQIKPHVTLTGNNGLLAAMNKGVHESDYYIEVTTVNNALLETVMITKVTIDTSPPHTGSVHDGFPDQPEVDFQQSRVLNSYWDGFFDKESGVWFYMYGYGSKCLSGSAFDIQQKTDNTSVQLTETYFTSGSFDTPYPGTYYVTVVAFNHALDHSHPVCSDGVTIDDTEVGVTNVIVKGSRTRAGLIRNGANRVWLLRKDRVRIEVMNPSARCIDSATLLSEDKITVLPSLRHSNGSEKGVTADICQTYSGVHADMMSFVISDEYLDVSWNVSNSSVSIHNFEVGLSSGNSTPDKMDFLSSRQHQHIRIHHPNIWDGEQFMVVIRTITKAAMKSDKIIGPFTIDTSSPDFQGKIDVNTEQSIDGHHLVVTWQPDAFTDHGDPAPLIYEVALGSVKYGHNILPFESLTPGCSCKVPITCTAINIDRLKWHLHGHQKYYITVKAINTVGLFTLASSDEYIHNVELPSNGVVIDVDIENDILLQDIVDIDFQTRSDRLSARWSGFYHPHVTVTFTVCIKGLNMSDLIECEDVGQKNEHTFTSLQLIPFETYTQIVKAKSEAGIVTVSSDGVTLVVEDKVIPEIIIKDGPGCSPYIGKALTPNTSYHGLDKRHSCQDDIEYQASINEIHARWTVPAHIRKYTPDVSWAIEERAPVADIWNVFRDFEHLKSSNHLSISNLALMSGRRYRVMLKFCASKYCFAPVTSNGFTVISRPPTPGLLTTSYNNATDAVEVQFSRFHDPDVEDPDEAKEVIHSYEWAFTDNSDDSRLIKKWEILNLTDQGDQIRFSVPVSPNITFTKCWNVAVRGYNKAGLSSVVSQQIRNCSDVNEVKPHLIIDAVGQSMLTKETLATVHDGQPISLSENDRWPYTDRDYTTYTNILSAVWPTLRYPTYNWAVLHISEEDSSIFYKSRDLRLREPCNHPDAIQCGTTEHEYMNALFTKRDLVHGNRYIVCVHANATILHFEKWDQHLDEFHACSDGITVDLTPPTPADVWIGKNMDEKYQSSSNCLTVNWQSFIDVEEEGHGVHVSGVENYQVAVGSTHGSIDVVDFISVGLTNHHMFHGLQLQNGHKYFASIKATDFTGQTSISVSMAILVDTTEPLTTGKSIQLPSRHITDTAAVSACWNDVFMDPESGISHFEWSVGSQRGYDDVMEFTSTDDNCGESDTSDTLGLMEGHAYYISVKAYNNAGQCTLAVSWAFTVDASPPTAGHVYDGPRREDGSYNDVDFVTSTSMIEAHWTEFYEVHGVVKEYTVSVGTCIGCDDVLAFQPIGIIYDIVLENLLLTEGVTYYVTVTACNTADLCTSSTSDGVIVDKTPPIPGHVMDGVEGKDVQYQASRSFLGAKWFGFVDPQSGISHYVWRVGTAPGGDDILPATQVHKLQEAFIVDITEVTGKKLPVGVRMYVTVRAFNQAGMYSESTSNGLIIDASGPVFSRHISTTHIGSAKQNTSILPHLIRVEWDVADNESFIDEQYMSIVSHIGGDFNESSIKVEGIVRDYTLTDLDLHDGSVYCVNLISCNGAGICSETKLEHLFVDSSHPTPGMFAINTDHSAALDRQPEDWMTWTVEYVRIAWLGFQDIHSGIDHYLINVGSTYMGNDLHEMSTDPHVVLHVNDGNQTGEGLVQTREILTKSLAKIRRIFISIWAINGVGLPSPIIHHEFELAFGGSMELVRRCNAHTCLGHCVCAPHGELCHSDNLCHDITNANPNSIVSTEDFINLLFPTNGPVINHTPVQTMSAARWVIKKKTENMPLWYEWSVGETMYDKPKGVFDATTERVWFDAAQDMSWVVSLPRDHYLHEKKTYSFFVRAWYDDDTYAVFKSPGLMAYTTPPQTISVRGIMVKETVKPGGSDVDYFSERSTFNIDWTGRFANDRCLTNFHLYISTSRGGHDAYCIQKNIAPSVTTFNLTGYHFEPETVYYSVVQAYNMAGFHTTDNSDGFKIDSKEPYPGIVHDGEGFIDIRALNSSYDIPSFWYGFSDQDSGIRSYNVCLSRDTDRYRCQIHPSLNVGLRTHVTLSTNATLPDGTRVISEVEAFDYVSHSTRPVRSNGVVIDTSPPRRSQAFTYQNNRVQNPSFEDSGLDHTLSDIEYMTKCDNNPPAHWKPTDNSCVLTVKTGKSNVLPEGQRFAVLTGTMQQQISNIKVGARYRLTIFSSHIPMKTAMLSACEGHVAINNEKHVFLLYGKPEISTDNSNSSLSLSWHEHVYYFEVKDSEVVLTIGTEGMTNHLAVDKIMFEESLEQDGDVEAAINGHVKARTIFIHNWSSLHAEWNFFDEHTDIVEYIWAIGTVEGGTQLQPFTSVGKRTFAFTSSLHLVHDTTVYVTVIAVNAASLRTVSYSDPILIDLTPPLFNGVNDGNVPGEDVDYQRELTISATWEVDDPESGIAVCQWALHTGTGDVLIKDFEVSEDGTRGAVVDIDRNYLDSDMVYVTVKCTNGAGLTSHLTSDGVKILTTPPSVDNVVLEIIGSSLTQYPPHNGYHGDPSYVGFRWTGFEDEEGVENYLVALDGGTLHVEELVSGNTHGFTYGYFTDLHLQNGSYTVSVTAINQLDMYSRKQSVDFILNTTKPMATGTPVQTGWTRLSKKLLTTWNDVFEHTPGLYYEVTVSWMDGGDGDIVQWVETKGTTLDISLDVDDIPGSGIDVRVSVRGITQSGQFEIVEAKQFIS